MDEQTRFGKVPYGVARIARGQGVRTIAIAGTIRPGYEQMYECGIDEIHVLAAGTIGVEEAKARAAELLEQTAMRIAEALRNN